jgi:glutathione S-transferase
MSAAVQVMVAEMQVPNLTFKRVDTLVLEQLSPGMLRLNPFGELPVLVHKGRAIYGPHIIVEFLIDEYPDNPVAQKLLVPLSSSSLSHTHLYRAKVRRWFGWVRTAYYYQLAHIWEAVWWGPTLRECFADEVELLKALLATPGREEDTVGAVEAFHHVGSAGELLVSVKPYVEELEPRIAYVEKELAANGGRFLCGGEDASYADLFVLPIVLLCSKYTAQAARTSVAEVLSTFPYTTTWVTALQQRGGPHGPCAKLMAEMSCLHGRPNIQQISNQYGYDYELVGEGSGALVYDPFIRNEALQVLRTHYKSRPGDIFVATYPKVEDCHTAPNS